MTPRRDAAPDEWKWASAACPEPPIDALFTQTQQRLLALLFGQPDRSFHMRELMDRTGSGSGAVQRELSRLARAGLLETRERSARRYFRADAASPVYAELVGLFRKTVGLAGPLREALDAFGVRTDLAFVFAPLGGAIDNRPRALELLVVSRSPRQRIERAAQLGGRSLGREINLLVLDRSDLEPARLEGSWYVRAILGQPRVWVVGEGGRCTGRDGSRDDP